MDPMRDFDGGSGPLPLDQAHGLRRLFAATRQRVLPLVSNPYVAFSGVVLDALSSRLAARGHRVLVVDAGESAQPPAELARIDLAAGVEDIAPGIAFLAARGLPLEHVDPRGSAGGFLDAIADAAPDADVVLLHASAGDLARVFSHRAARPLLLAADGAESVKHAYAGCKLLARRCRLLTFDLLLAGDPRRRRLAAIAASVAGCADRFVGAVLRNWAVVDPAGDPLDAEDAEDAALARLLDGQLRLQESWPGSLPVDPRDAPPFLPPAHPSARPSGPVPAR
jgi:flagellar biosynthesis protein FlhG